jgi:hypothetical protein
MHSIFLILEQLYRIEIFKIISFLGLGLNIDNWPSSVSFPSLL